MPEANATALPDSSPPTISSSASQVGVPSSREYTRPAPRMKFDAGTMGTFSGAPGSDSRPAETSHDSGLIPDGCFSILRTPPDGPTLTRRHVGAHARLGKSDVAPVADVALAESVISHDHHTAVPRMPPPAGIGNGAPPADRSRRRPRTGTATCSSCRRP